MSESKDMPWFSGTTTFLRSPLGDFEDISPGTVVISGAPHAMRERFNERLGPRGIRESSLFIAERLRVAGDEGIIDTVTGRRMLIPGQPRLLDVGDLNMYPSSVMKATEGIAGGIAEVVTRGGFSVCLGGDHYVGYPSCLGYTRAAELANPRVKVGYIHIDGHLDFADETPPNGRYNNGTNARRIAEIGVMSPSNMVWIGIQGPCSWEQVEAIRMRGGTIFTSEDIHEIGPAEVGKRAGELAIKGCDYIYMSFDIDVIDAGFSNGTGSVTMGALTPIALLKLLDELAKYPIGSMDLVENSPELDPSGRTSRMAAESLLRLIVPKIFDIG